MITLAFKHMGKLEFYNPLETLMIQSLQINTVDGLIKTGLL